MARPARGCRRRRPVARPGRAGPAAAASGRPPGDPRPRLRQRIDGPMARPAPAGIAALGHARPRPGPAGGRRREPTRTGRRRRPGRLGDAALGHHPAAPGRPRRREPDHRLGAARPDHGRSAGRPGRALLRGWMPGAADAVGGRARRAGTGRSARSARCERIRHAPAALDGGRPAARTGCRCGHRRALPPAGAPCPRPAQPVAARRRRRRPGGGVAHGMARCRLQAGARAGRRRQRVRGPPSGAGSRRAAHRHRRPRRPAGAAVTTTAVRNPDGALLRIARRRDQPGGASSISGTGWSRSLWSWARPAGAAITLAVVVWRLGAGPFLDGVRAVDGRAVAAIGLMTTLCCAWRWTVVARGLGVRLSLPFAVAAYYRSLFLNLTLPGGVVGDVHRGVSHGRDVDDVGRGLRAVAWERAAGQVVQVVITVAVLLALPSPVRSSMPLVAVALAETLIVAVLVGRVRRRGGSSRWARLRNAMAGDVRDGLLTRRALPVIVLVSAVVVIGHAVTLMIAARTAGATAPASRMLPLALLAMMAMVLPGVAGWGPREGATAWVFGAAGLGASQGVATAVVYGVMVLVASLPGAVVLVAGWLRRARPAVQRESLPARIRVVSRSDGAADA